MGHLYQTPSHHHETRGTLKKGGKKVRARGWGRWLWKAVFGTQCSHYTHELTAESVSCTRSRQDQANKITHHSNSNANGIWWVVKKKGKTYRQESDMLGAPGGVGMGSQGCTKIHCLYLCNYQRISKTYSIKIPSSKLQLFFEKFTAMM